MHLCRLDPLRTICSSLFILRLHLLSCPSPDCAAFTACRSPQYGTLRQELLRHKASWWCTPLLHQFSPTWAATRLSLRLVPLFLTFFNNSLGPACHIGVKMTPVLHAPWSTRTRTMLRFQNLSKTRAESYTICKLCKSCCCKQFYNTLETYVQRSICQLV